MHRVVTGKFWVKCAADEVPVSHDDRGHVVAGEHLDGGADGLDTRGTDEYTAGTRTVSQNDVALPRGKLTAVRVAAHRDRQTTDPVETVEGARVEDVVSEKDEAGTGAQHRHSSLNALTNRGHQLFPRGDAHHCGAFAAGKDQRVNSVELLACADRLRGDVEAPKHRDMLSEGALKSQDADGFTSHGQPGGAERPGQPR